MTIFEKIRIKGFRRLFDVDLNLRPLNVVIGANGSGKTSILDVFSMLAASASGKLNETMSQLGGVESNFTNLIISTEAKAKSLAFELEMGVAGHKPLQYSITLTNQGIGYEISDESLVQWQNKTQPFKHLQAHFADVKYFEPPPKGMLVRPNWDYSLKESALSQIPKMFREPEDFRKRLGSSTHYHVLDVSRRAPIRLPQQMRDAKLPGHDGQDIVSCLYTIRETDRDHFELIEATLKAGFPTFERLNFPPVAAGTLAMTWKDSTSSTPFYMHQLSEGTLRFLWLTTLLLSPGLTEVTMIDEPEVSLHPELLCTLAELLRNASKRTQLIVATHADRLVRFLEPSEVLTVNIGEGGASELIWADTIDLENWLDEYTLDEIWANGQLGARA